MRERISRWGLSRNMPAIPPKRASSLQRRKSSGAKRTRICRSSAAFMRESPRVVELPYVQRMITPCRLISARPWFTGLIASLAFSYFVASAGEAPVRYLRFDEVQETLRLNADSRLPGDGISNSVTWDAWIRARDAEVRGRIDRGIEDSISNLILYGSSFTPL